MEVDKSITITEKVLGNDITANIQILDHGVCATIVGGQLSHIGSISVINDDGVLQTTIFIGHKDNVIGDKWARKLFEQYRVPVVVTAGIHYDNVSRSDIYQLINVTEKMLSQII